MNNIEEFLYGSFTGGDPRDFQPDPEAATSEEIESHKKACEEFNKAEKEGKSLPALPSPHLFTEWGRIKRQPFGLGVQKHHERKC